MPSAWLRVSVSVPESAAPDLAERIVEALIGHGGGAVAEEDARLITHLPVREDEAADAVGERIRRGLQALAGPGAALVIDLEVVAEQDWLALWRAGLAPRRIGPHLVVSPTWSPAEAAGKVPVIRIDPQMAFGTGEHASTRGVLRLMQAVVSEGGRLLDVGTGSAILAIAAARLGSAHVLAAEGDADALPNALDNVAMNGVADRVTLEHAVVTEDWLRGRGAFDGILANVLSGVLIPLLPGFHRALRPAGWVILAGILREEAPDVRAAARAAGFGIEAEDAEQEWWSVRLRRLEPVTGS